MDLEKKYRFMLGAVVVIAAIILFRIFYLQTIDRGFLVEKSLRQRATPIPIQAERGVIKSNDGTILATSVPTFNVYSDNRYIKSENRAQVAKTIADFFKVDYNEVLKKINGNYYAELVKGVSKTQVEQFEKIKPKGINYYKTNSRVYPNNDVFGNVLGFVGQEGNGLSGLELSLNKYLGGVDGSNSSEKDKYGNPIDYDTKHIVPAVDGNDVTLTIDYNIQYQMYKELKSAVDTTKSRKGVAISINPNNGEIIGIAEYPSYNPNKYKDYPQDLYKSSAVSMTYEPGSTFKPITVAIADSLNLLNYDTDRFYDGGAFRVDSYTIGAWNHKGFGVQTVEEVLKNSSNAGAAQIGLRIPVAQYQSYLSKLGFGHKTGIELSGESNSIMQSNTAFQSKISRATTSFGQGIAVTPIQLMNAWCSIVNGGYTIKPHILKSVTDENGSIVYSDTAKNAQGERIFSAETSLRVRKMLQAVVEDGTGKKAKIDGYTVGGKTGTAQIAENGVYIKGRNIVSFMGFAPVENPKIMTLVILDSPADSASVGGGLMCGPVVKNILEYSLEKFGIKPNFSVQTDSKTTAKKSDTSTESSKTEISVATEDYRYRPKSYMLSHQPTIPYEFKGNGDIITDQNYISQDGKTKIVFSTASMISGNYLIMPNLSGMNPEEFMQLFGKYSSSIVINGNKNTAVTMQDTKGGQQVDLSTQKATLWTE